MKSKLLSIVFLVLLAIFALTACINVTPPPDDGEKTEYAFFIKDASDSTDYSTVLSELNTALGYSLVTYNDSGSASGAEIIVGNTGRQVTASAKTALESELAGVDLVADNDIAAGYVIFSSGESLAVYWNSSYMMEPAFDALIALLTDENASISDGVVVKAAYSLLDYVNDQREVTDAEKWAAIESNSPETAQALREALEFYEKEKIYEFFGELYDPVTGAFYYSVTARDYDGFLPDIESTSQILRHIRDNGYLDGYDGPMAAYPKEMQEKFISFTQSLQSAEDGYFYHPQWGTDIKTQRLGRDQNNSLVVLSMFGAKPLYSTGSDRLEGNFDEDDFDVSYKSEGALTAPLGGSAVVAASKVVATAASDSRFESLESFMAWVNETVEGKTSHTFGHAFSSSGRQINAAGYMDELLDYLDAMQAEVFETQMAAHLADPENNPEPSGLWQPEKDYTSMSGCFKIVGMYNSYDREIDEKYIPYMVKAAVEAINIPAEAHYTDYPLKQMVYIYNPWAGLGRVFINMNKYNAELYEDMIAITRVNAPDMIYNTVKKLNLFRRSDGSFAYFVEGAAATTQGVPVALGLPDEGDVNATGLAFGMYQDMFETLGYEYIKPYDSSDFLEFLDICQSMLPPDKISLTSSDPYDFSDLPFAINTVLNNGSAEIVDDPVTGDGSVYRFDTVAGAGESVYIKANGNYINSNCYVFETDLCIYEMNDYSIPFSIRFGSKKSSQMTYRVDLVVSGNTVSLVDNSGDKKKSDLNVKAKVGEWFNIKIEYYVTEEGPKIKVYQDGAYVGFSDNFSGSHLEDTAPQNVFEYLQIWGMKNAEAALLIDNTVCTCANKEYVDELVINSYDFESGSTTLSATGTNAKLEVVTAGGANKMLSLSSSDPSKTATYYLTIPLTASSPKAEVKTIGFDLMIPSSDINGNDNYNEIAGDLFHATDNAAKAILKYGIYTGESEVLRLAAVAEENGSVSNSYSLFLYGQDDKPIGEAILKDIAYDELVIIEIELDLSDGEYVIVNVNGKTVAEGDLMWGTDDGDGGKISNYAPEGGIKIQITQLKRFVSATYHDNIFVEFSEEMAE